MKLRRNISIKEKIVIIITIISAVSVLLSLVINVSSRIIETINDFEVNAVNDAQLIGDYCVMPIVFESPERANEVLEKRVARGRITCAAVYTINGKLFGSACREGTDVPDSILSNENYLEFMKNDLLVQEPIIYNENHYGTVFIKYDTGLRTTIIQQIIFSLLLLLAIAVIAFFLALRLQRIISLPILKLASVASKISETQDYKTEIIKQSNDEVGILYDRFDQMIKTISSREGERDSALKALKQSEEKFRNIFNFSLDGILVTNTEGKVLEASSMAATIFDIPFKKLKGQLMVDLMPSAYSKQRGMIIREIMNKGEFTFVTTYKTESNADRYLEFSSKEINQDGEKAFLSLVRDITTRIKADEALRESEERYKKLVENLPSAIALHRNGEIVFVNDAIKGVLEGRTKEEFVGKKILDFIPEENRETISNHFAITDINASSPTLELKMLKMNGIEIEAELTSMPLYFNRQKAILTVFKDISQRKQTEKDLVIALQKAEESDKLKSSFLANMSHEIRTPMNGIIGFADLLKKKNLTENDLNRYVDVIRTSADRLLGIINDIIDISKIEAGAINIVKEQFVVNKLVDEIYQFFVPQATKKNIEFILNCDSNSDLSILSDRNKISQIVTNLISNAVKFTHEGKVEVSCTISNNRLKIIVDDTGIGIPKEQQASVFERFRQADHYLQNFKEGTGLGLSISRGFAIALGGDIKVESIFEEGSRFTVDIPVEFETDIVAIEGSTSGEELHLPGKTILIVEDEENNFMYLKELIERTEATILWADNGLKAVQFVLDNAEIDFVLMDIKLPIMDGFTAAQKIKAYRESLPIVAQTAFGLEGDKEKSLAAGLDDYIPKPIIKEELFRVMTKYLK